MGVTFTGRTSGSPSAKAQRNDTGSGRLARHLMVLPASPCTTSFSTSSPSNSTYSGKIASVAMSREDRLSFGKGQSPPRRHGRRRHAHLGEQRVFSRRECPDHAHRPRRAAQTQSHQLGWARPRTKILAAGSQCRRRAHAAPSSSTAWPISCPHRGSTGIATTGCLRRITSSGPPSRRWPSATSASNGRPRTAGMGTAVAPRGAAVTRSRIKSPARTTRLGLAGPSSWRG